MYFFQQKIPTINGQVNGDQISVSNEEAVKNFPMRLKIPVIGVDARVQMVGLTSNNEMEVPTNSTDVGWFKIGPRPGEIDNAVIAGHFDSNDGKEGVFSKLNELRVGDELYVEDESGVSKTFTLRESRVYDLGYAPGIFSQSDGSHLNLITCDGVWESGKKSYSKRLVVFTDLKN